MDLILTLFFLLMVILVGLIPFPLLYIFSDFIRFILHRVAGYRKKVIISNLQSCFPGISGKELDLLVKNVYRNLADVLVEGIKAFTMSKRQVKARHKFINPEIIDNYLPGRKAVIALPNHFNNWEWGTLSPGLFSNRNFVALYKPLSNKYIDRYMRSSRTKYGTTLASIYKTGLVFERHLDHNTIFVLAADQSPTNPRKSYWVPFLGRDTAFLHGPEKYARLHDLPVLFVDIQRVKRGFYELKLIEVVNNPSEVPDGEITRRYAAFLEEAIRENPGSWLWSHRRWKLQRPAPNGSLKVKTEQAPAD